MIIWAAVRETIDSGKLRTPAEAIFRVMTEQNSGHVRTPVDPAAIQCRLSLR
ncbi:MAG: hypothetical protein ABWX74_10905 [Aeromicrobium sp.]